LKGSAARSSRLSSLVAASLLAAVLTEAGCGYALVGRSSTLPDNIRIVQFTTLENQTQRVQLEQRFSGEIARELASRGRFQVQASAAGADAELTGAVLAFNLFPVAFDAQGRATDYQVQVTARVSLKTIPDGKVLWENPAYTFRDNYSYAATAASYVDLENDAIDRVAGRFAQALVTSMLEGF
jgi:outer membrane lipopolysaccharide assembly protein LptE/RlpB